MPQVGPITMWVISTTRTPDSGRFCVLILSPGGFLDIDLAAKLGFRALSAKHNHGKQWPKAPATTQQCVQRWMLDSKFIESHRDQTTVLCSNHRRGFR
jgi:hypothetical protein